MSDFHVILKEAVGDLPWVRCGQPIVRLSKASDGTEQSDVEAVTSHFPLIKEIFESTKCNIPTGREIMNAFRALDVSHGGKFSGGTSSRAQHQWAEAEAERLHFLLSYTARLCRRSPSSKTMKVAQLKKIWRRYRDTRGEQVGEIDVEVVCLQTYDEVVAEEDAPEVGTLHRSDAQASESLQDAGASVSNITVEVSSSSEEEPPPDSEDAKGAASYKPAHADISSGVHVPLQPASIAKTAETSKAVAPPEPPVKKRTKKDTQDDETPAKKKIRKATDEESHETPEKTSKDGSDPVIKRMNDGRWIVKKGKLQVLNLQDHMWGPTAEQCEIWAKWFAKLFEKGLEKDDVVAIKKKLQKGMCLTIEGEEVALTRA